MQSKQGLIIKLIGGQYSVFDYESHLTYVCKPRGVFRHKDVNPKVGDHVVFEAADQKHGTIVEVGPRRNDLVRPYIANVDKAILVFSVKKPELNLNLLDRFLALIEFNNIEPILIFSKMDLLDKSSHDEVVGYTNYYKNLGYVTYHTSVYSMDKSILLDEIKDKVCVISGQSGVGKSSLLNAIDPNLNLKTDEISEALNRGKHTTRHVELIPLNDGWIADTPGFGLLEFHDMNEIDLAHSFIEFFEKSNKCKFNGCLHDKEPNCAVKKAVATKEIMLSRYENYLSLLNEIREKNKNKY